MNKAGVLTKFMHKVPVILEEGTILSATCNILRTPQVDIDCITVWFHHFGRSKKNVWIVSAELGEHVRNTGQGAQESRTHLHN